MEDKICALEEMMKNITFTDEECDVIKKYQSPGNDGISGEVNRLLYNKELYRSDESKNQIDVLSRACRKGKMPIEMEVLRGEDDLYYGFLEPDCDDEAWKGKIIEKKGFISTSVKRPFNRSVQYRITVPKGINAIYIPAMVQNKYSGEFEGELLIDKGYKLKIDHIERDDKGYPTIYATVLVKIKL